MVRPETYRLGITLDGVGRELNEAPLGVRARRRDETVEGWNVLPEGAWQESQSRPLHN